MRAVIDHAPSAPADAWDLHYEVARYDVPMTAVWMAYGESLMLTESADWDWSWELDCCQHCGGPNH